MASELAGKELFDELSTLLRGIRKRAQAKGDGETLTDADKADVLLRNFSVAVGHQVRELTTMLIADREVALKKSLAALRGYEKANHELEGITVDAIASIEVVLEKWPKGD